MNWVYILLRTFPFWGVPIGIVMFFSGISNKKKKYIALGAVLMASGGAFLYYGAQFTAVPFAYHMLYGKN